MRPCLTPHLPTAAPTLRTAPPDSLLFDAVTRGLAKPAGRCVVSTHRTPLGPRVAGTHRMCPRGPAYSLTPYLRLRSPGGVDGGWWRLSLRPSSHAWALPPLAITRDTGVQESVPVPLPLWGVFPEAGWRGHVVGPCKPFEPPPHGSPRRLPSRIPAGRARAQCPCVLATPVLCSIKPLPLGVRGPLAVHRPDSRGPLRSPRHLSAALATGWMQGAWGRRL